MKLRDISKLGLSKGRLLITIGLATGLALVLWLKKKSNTDLFNIFENKRSRYYRGKKKMKIGKKAMHECIRKIVKEEADNDKYNLWI